MLTKNGTLDALTVLNDGGAITASKAGYVDSAAKVVDLGANSRMDAKAIVNVATAGTGTGEKQVITIQASDDNFVADIVTVGTLELGAAAMLVGDVAQGAGQYEVPFTNVVDGVAKRYVRSYATITVVSPVTSLNYEAHLVPLS